MYEMRSLAALVASLILAGSTMLPLRDAEAHAARSQLRTNTYVWISVGAHSLDGIYSIAYGDVPALELRRSMDGDGDGVVSPAEYSTFVEELRARLARCLSFEMDGSSLEFGFHDAPATLESSAVVPEWLRIDLQFSSSLGEGNGGEVTISDSCELLARGESEYRLEPALGVTIDFVSPEATLDEGIFSLSFTRPPPPSVRLRFDAQNAIDPGGSAALVPAGEVELPEPEPNPLAELLSNSQALTFWALLLAFGLGTLHALSPGHGKTLVAAYLVGERGTTWQAILLGLVVTVTHVSSVVAVGLLALLASEYFLPDSISKVLSVFSGLLIVLIGAFMLRTRLKQKLTLFHPHQGDPVEHHDHNDGHGPLDHDHDAHGRHIHDDERDAHDHDHRGHLHPTAGVSMWKLLTLGVSGGLVPCPSAMVVLLLAIAVGRVLEGMLLIGAFSVGLAFVLVALGILVVRAERLLDTYLPSRRRLAWLPVASAFLVTIIGIVITINGLLGL